MNVSGSDVVRHHTTRHHLQSIFNRYSPVRYHTGAVPGQNIWGPAPPFPSYSPHRLPVPPLTHRPLLIQLEVLGNAVNSPIGVSGGATAEIEFCAFYP